MTPMRLPRPGEVGIRNMRSSPPDAYLKCVRLNRVRNDLRQMESAETSVQAVANNWGFWHMGHCARDYKELFRELPSETLARRTFR